jgi:hypothetical protein
MRLLKKLFRLELWNIGVARFDAADLDRLIEQGRLPALTWLPELKGGRYRADPFIWDDASGARLIYEELPPWEARAYIGSLPLENLRDAGRDELRLPYHLSYPFMLRHDGKTLCVPECGESGRVDAWAWNAADGRWSRLATLLHEPVVDGTLIEHRGHWYLFGSLLDDGPMDKLRIWHAERLEGPWERHALDPAKESLASSRGAGTPFVHKGVLYRPSQDCTGGYGRAVAVNRIDVLSPTEFSETTVSRIVPDTQSGYGDGLHTLSLGSGWLAIDGKRHITHPCAALLKLLWALGHRRRRARAAQAVAGV